MEAGDTATFRCNAVADTDLNLDINWLKDGRKIEFDTEPRFIQVIIIITIISHGNVFVCEADLYILMLDVSQLVYLWLTNSN